MKRATALRWFAVSAALLAGANPPARSSTDESDAFEKVIRPILVENCRECHGTEKQKGGLRLDARTSLIEGGESGPAVIPGRPDESLLIAAVRQHGDLKMPPKRRLRDDQVESLARWVAAGAPWPGDSLPSAKGGDAWRKHWAFQPVRPVEPPPVREAGWCHTPIDAFILARLEDSGLAPAPTADRRTLIRRACYDLTGLPPSPEEVDAFVADDSSDAYERLVDRLLASPHHGEQWARHWLDVARYSDTKGYVYDREERFFVQAPAYRDWVVKAFNDDMPFDRFLLLQIAADRASPGDRTEIAALGFLTLGRRFLGVTRDIIDDRIDVVTRGAMGLTVACARCHDHKFDPIPTSDYYSLCGVFQNVTERTVPLADGGPEAFRAELERRQRALRSELASSRAEAARRARAHLADYLMAQRNLQAVPQEGFDVVLGKDDLIPAFVRRWASYLESAAEADDAIFRPWRRLSGLRDEEFTARAGEVTREFRDSGLNRLVARAFASPPASIREVADRYARLLDEVEQLGRGREGPLTDPDAEAVRQVFYGPHSPCVVPDEEIVSIEWFFDSDAVVRLWRLQGEVDRWQIRSPDAPPYGVAIQDRAEIREPRVFRRGNPATPGDKVSRHFLTALSGPSPRPFVDGSGRLELARAIVDPANPLTARVWVNRVWMHHFGAGLVRSPSDFGLRAEPPSHPELLDWLADRLVKEGWSTRALHRVILLSAAYRQQSVPPPDARRRDQAIRVDPANRLLWRMNPRRLTFEEARDTLLAASGELDRRFGGRASDLFPAGGENRRRTLYGLVDRQFLPGTLRVFDFANPDLHIPARTETTVPQQALFAMNHPFLAGRARVMAARARSEASEAPIRRLYRAAFQREPTEAQLHAARAFLDASSNEPEPTPRAESLAWSYGYGELDACENRVKAFQRLPHFNGSAWGGGPQWPDATLGWVRLTAQGGHAGNDLRHAAIRRWTAPRDATVAIRSTATHEPPAGDGVRCRVVSDRRGVLASAVVYRTSARLDVGPFEVEAGEVVDFVVDFRDGLNSDEFLWAPEVREIGTGTSATWDAARDFAGPAMPRLTPLEQLAQVLLMANELMFVD